MSTIPNISYKVILLLAPLLVVSCVTAPLIDPNVSTVDCQKFDTEITTNLKVSFENSDYNKSNKQTTNLAVVKQSNSNIKNALTKAKRFQCTFPLASKAGLSIKTSGDKKLRVFTWNENTGGSKHDYAGYYQFQDSQGTVHLQDKNVGSIKHAKHSIPNALFMTTLNGKATYMLASTGIFSTNNQSQYLQALTINGDKVESAKVIRTNSGLTNTVGFKYDFQSVANRPERPIQLFEFNNPTNSFRFPVVENDSKFPNGKVTNEFIEYKFDGTQFMRVAK